jgi:bacillaene synthase trans-acting acyltransferase
MTKRKTAWMFSGQGSQYYNMGRDLYDLEPVFRDCMDLCDRIVEPWIHASLNQAIHGGDRSGNFDDTRLTHLAICAVQYAMARTLQARGHNPDLLIGYSLGEIVAHMVAETIALETGLEMLHRHASLMESATPEGGMLAILEDPEALRPALEEIPGLWMAAHNFKNHCVVSGASRSLDQLQRRLEPKQITMQRLPVRRAFHSPLMDPAEPEFRSHVRSICPRTPRFDIVSATTGFSSNGLDGLWNATRAPLDFPRAIRRVEAGHREGFAYLDLGPSGTLATFVKYIGVKPESAYFSIMTPWGGAQKNIQAYENAV